MKRLENAVVAPATLFMGVTLLAVAGAVVYYATRGEDEDDTDSGGGGAPDVAPTAEDWNTSTSDTKSAPVTVGKTYSTRTAIPSKFAAMSFDVRPSGGMEVLDVTGPYVSQTPGVGALIGVTFKASGPGAVELVWPENAVVGQDILVLYRRLNVTTGTFA